MVNFMIALDCTLRDGGYYPDWNFDLNLANKYLKIMEMTKIDAVEVGFRSPPEKKVGQFAKAYDEFIEDNLYIPNIKYLAVMLNAGGSDSALIKKLFQYSDKSPINLVRLAIHFKDIDKGESLCKDLKNLGYTVSCNLMQSAGKSFNEISEVTKQIRNWNSVDILYIADSLGNMNVSDIDYAFKAVKSEWDSPTGLHAHNNKGQALTNSLEAVDFGVDWIDGCVTGMGRGPGNTETEYLLSELNKRGYGEFNVELVYELALNDFLPLQTQYGWGPSLVYFLSAEYMIHPTYIQTAIADGYSMSKVLKMINYLKNKDSNFFNKQLYKELLNEQCYNNTSQI